MSPLVKFPANETLLRLRREAEAGAFTLPSSSPTAQELRALIDAFERLTPEQRATLDATTFTSEVVSNAINGVPVGGVGEGTVTYRILGVGENGVLLLEEAR